VISSPIDLADIQGDILKPYGNDYAHASYVFVGVTDPAAGRRWLSERLDGITTAAPWDGAKPDATCNVALTRAGLEALGVPAAVVTSFSDEFIQGMAARSQELGDSGDNAPAHWEDGLGTGAAHVLVTLKARSEDALRAAVGELRDGLADADGLSAVYEQHAHVAGDTREHFGFADGFSQPALEGIADADTIRGEGVPEQDDWRPLALGEFILGYEDEESRSDAKRRLPSAPTDPLGRSGSYLVWRKLQEDVALFRRTISAGARLYADGDEAKLMAKVVGRWPNGAPLVTAPAAQPADFDPGAPGSNDFRYASDPDGRRCPLGAHVRRSNPRDTLGFEGKLSFRHRIIRRGMPYGPELAPGSTEDDHQERGLVFACFNASISRQFESIQRQWLNDGNSFHLGGDTDFILGAPSGKMTIQGDPPFFLAPQGPFVTLRGGEYLFAPGMTALAAIADGVAG
jgi:Dyp-type peroxidase family